jgi:hypothetical protein
LRARPRCHRQTPAGHAELVGLAVAGGDLSCHRQALPFVLGVGWGRGRTRRCGKFPLARFGGGCFARRFFPLGLLGGGFFAGECCRFRRGFGLAALFRFAAFLGLALLALDPLALHPFKQGTQILRLVAEAGHALGHLFAFGLGLLLKLLPALDQFGDVALTGGQIGAGFLGLSAALGQMGTEVGELLEGDCQRFRAVAQGRYGGAQQQCASQRIDRRFRPGDHRFGRDARQSLERSQQFGNLRLVGVELGGLDALFRFHRAERFLQPGQLVFKLGRLIGGLDEAGAECCQFPLQRFGRTGQFRVALAAGLDLAFDLRQGALGLLLLSLRLLGLRPGRRSHQSAEEGSRRECRPPHALIPRRAARCRGGSAIGRSFRPAWAGASGRAWLALCQPACHR